MTPDTLALGALGIVVFVLILAEVLP